MTVTLRWDFHHNEGKAGLYGFYGEWWDLGNHAWAERKMANHRRRKQCIFGAALREDSIFTVPP
jgi:hypothetical protein